MLTGLYLKECIRLFSLLIIILFSYIDNIFLFNNSLSVLLVHMRVSIFLYYYSNRLARTIRNSASKKWSTARTNLQMLGGLHRWDVHIDR